MLHPTQSQTEQIRSSQKCKYKTITLNKHSIQEHIIKPKSKKANQSTFIYSTKSQNKTLHTHTHQEQIEEHKTNQKSPKARVSHKLH